MKIVFKLDATDKKGQNTGVRDFLNATKDNPRKFVSFAHDGSDEPNYIVRALVPSRNVTYFGEGVLGQDELQDARQSDESGHLETYDIFEDAGFVTVNKIVED